jgi:gas vesicle protein
MSKIKTYSMTKFIYEGSYVIMRKNSMGIMKLGAIGALAGLVLVPVMSSKTRRRISRSSRNAYFRVTDFVNDIKDMTTR